MAQEAATAVETSAYKRGVLETEARLTAEVIAVCREYCVEMYNQALDWAGIPTDSNLRRIDQVYYPDDLRENTTAPPYPAALPPPLEQSLIIPKLSQGAEAPAGAEKEKNGAVVVSQTEEKPKEKEKEKGKEKAKNRVDANPSEDALTIGDMVSNAKTTESKSKIDSKKDSHQSQA